MIYLTNINRLIDIDYSFIIMDPISHINSLNTLKIIESSFLPSLHIQPTFYNCLMSYLLKYLSTIMARLFIRQQRMDMTLLKDGNSLRDSLVSNKRHLPAEPSNLHSNYAVYISIQSIYCLGSIKKWRCLGIKIISYWYLIFI